MTRATVVLPIGAVVLLAISCGGEEVNEPDRQVVSEQGAEEATIPEPEETDSGISPLSFRSVTVYFPSVYDGLLSGEVHEIFETASPGDRAKQIISDLLAGPDAPDLLRAVPQGVRLRQVYVTPDGTAYADFSSDLAHRMGGGSEDEIMAVYAVVNSLVLNIEEIERVGILLDGEPCDTLNGHVDLRYPLPANHRLLQETQSQQEEPSGEYI